MAKREFLPALRGLVSSVYNATGGVERKDLAQRVRASSNGYLVPGQPYVDNWNVRRATREAYEGNPLVYRAIEVICQHGIRQPIVIRRGDPDEGPKISRAMDPTRLLYVFNRRANPWETAKIFRHRLIAQFLLSSKGVFIEVIRTQSGKIGMVNLLDPDLCNLIPLEKRDIHNRVVESDPIGTIQILNPGGGYDYLPRFKPDAKVEDQPSSVLWIRSPHPLVMWKGMSPVQAAGLPIDLDRYARIYNRRFLQNDGRPGGLISIKGTVDKGTMERLQAQFNGGPESAGRTTVIQGDAVSYADTSGSPRDMLWGELSAATRKDIAMTFGVPESVLGDASGRTFDNADAEYELFWTGRMSSLLDALDDQLDVLTGGYDDDLFLRHDLSNVYVLGRHKRAEQDRAAANLDRGAITVDEYRDVIDQDAFDIPATRVLWLPGGKIPAGKNDDDTKEAAALQTAGMGQPADPGAEAQAGAAQGAALGARINENNTDARLLRASATRIDRQPAVDQKSLVGDPEGEQSRARAVRTAQWG